MPLESISVWKLSPSRAKNGFLRRTHVLFPQVLASQSMEAKKRKVLKELGLFSLKRKIEDTVHHAEIMATTALELEEARRIHQEEVLLEDNLWEKPLKSKERLNNLANAIKDVNALKDAKYKVEEAKLIVQLADMDFIDHRFLEQAYKASIDGRKILERYEISKLLRGQYDKDGACIIISARSQDYDSEVWVEKLLNMYSRWAEKQGYKGRISDIEISKRGGISSASIDFESEYFYGYLLGEEGTHLMVRNSNDGSVVQEAYAVVEVIPLFLESEACVSIDDSDLDFSSPQHTGEQSSGESCTSVIACHLPTGASVQGSGERSHFANKLKATNRLKAKLVAVAWKQGLQDIGKIDGRQMETATRQVVRRYVFGPRKYVDDVQTALELSNLASILDGGIEPFLSAHIQLRSEGLVQHCRITY